jgi:hypothetical protein
MRIGQSPLPLGTDSAQAAPKAETSLTWQDLLGPGPPHVASPAQPFNQSPAQASITARETRIRPSWRDRSPLCPIITVRRGDGLTGFGIKEQGQSAPWWSATKQAGSPVPKGAAYWQSSPPPTLTPTVLLRAHGPGSLPGGVFNANRRQQLPVHSRSGLLLTLGTLHWSRACDDPSLAASTLGSTAVTQSGARRRGPG